MVEDEHQDQNCSYDEEREETLSLCDLPRDSFRWDDEYFSGSSKKYQTSSFDDDEEEEDDNNFFEFFSEDFTVTSTNYPNPKEIIFCGKLIPLVGKDQVNHDQNQKPNEEIIRQEKPRSAKHSMFQYLKPKPKPNDGKSLALPSPTTTTTKKKCPYDNKQKVSFLGSSPAVKSRWYLFMFGMRAPSMEMGLRDMKNRQSRRRRSHSSTMFPSFEETTAENVSAKPRRRRRRSGKGFWGLLRALSCRSRHAVVVAKAAYGRSAIRKA